MCYPKAPAGADLAKAMAWAIVVGKMSQVTDVLAGDHCYDLVHNGSVHQLKLLIQNWTGGEADKIVTYNVYNGPDARRELYHHELPDVAHQISQLTSEFTAPKPASSATDMKSNIQVIDRITSRM